MFSKHTEKVCRKRMNARFKSSSYSLLTDLSPTPQSSTPPSPPLHPRPPSGVPDTPFQMYVSGQLCHCSVSFCVRLLMTKCVVRRGELPPAITRPVGFSSCSVCSAAYLRVKVKRRERTMTSPLFIHSHGLMIAPQRAGEENLNSDSPSACLFLEPVALRCSAPL